MTADSPAPSSQIRNYVADTGEFDEEQVVTSRSWYLPTRTIEILREYIIGEYGTTKHIGAFCTRAMRNWMADNPDDDLHRTWSHLKHDYHYPEKNVRSWNYRHYHDYTEMDKSEKTALCFSAPESLVDEFTGDLSNDEYGAELANAIEAELVKRAQIAEMQDHISNAERVSGEATVDATPPKAVVDEDGNRVDLSEVTLDDTIALEQGDVFEFAEEAGVDWKQEWENRRGLLAACIRSCEEITKQALYQLDESAFGVDKTASQRKDYKAILKQAEEEPAEPLEVAPARRVFDEMDTNNKNLPQAVGLTHRNQPLEAGDYDLWKLNYEVYNSNEHSMEEMWDEFVCEVCDIAYDLARVEWNVGDSVRMTYNGKHLKDSIRRYLPVLETTKDVLEDIDGLLGVRLGLIAEIDEEIERLNDVKKNIAGVNGQDIDAAHQDMVEENITPDSWEFRTKGRQETGQALEW